MQISPARVAELPAPRPAMPEPSLGEVRFDEWFDTPVFESDADERLEELATSRRGPLRLAAGALLRVNARTPRAARRAAQPAEDFYDARVWADDIDEADGTDDPWLATAGATPAQPADETTVDTAACEDPAGTDRAPNSRRDDGSPGVRARLSGALDRWAEKEALMQQRLERLMLPRRWQS